jgi:hypothetical protein
MSGVRLSISTVLAPLFMLACSKGNEEEIDKECHINIDTMDFTFGIDYENPEKYLDPGDESDLSEEYLEEVRGAIGTPELNLGGILEVCLWVSQNFSFSNAGGAMAGENTVDELFSMKTFYGCHSHALVISSVLRELGFPAVMIETASVQWAYQYHAGTVQYFAGHVMSEIYVDERWILLDNNGTYVLEYDPLNPYIPVEDHPTDAYFTFAKGVDIWDYGGKDENFTGDKLEFFAENIYCFEPLFNTVSYSWGP